MLDLGNIMADIFTTRIIRDLSKNKNRILDAGCGAGVQALYLARRNLESLVYGYDISTEQIAGAEGCKQKHKITNAYFSIASHDNFEPPYKMDFIYSCGSLVGDHEIPPYSADVLESVEELVRKRLTKFNEMLATNGIYLFIWGAIPDCNNRFIKIARECQFKHSSTRIAEERRFKHSSTRTNDLIGYIEYFGEPIRLSALIFAK